MLSAIAIGLVAILVVVLVLAFAQPGAINIKRSLDITASPERVFGLINDFQNWPKWAPQDQGDATMQRTFSGSSSGRGAISEWTSRGKAGCGRMEIVEAISPARIKVKVDFVKPFVAHNLNEFILESNDGITRVSWQMRGTNPFVARVMGVFVNMDRMLGKHFEAGLNNLKTLTER